MMGERDIFAPLDACGQDRCEKYNQFSRSSKPAHVLSTERVLCFLSASVGELPKSNRTSCWSTNKRYARGFVKRCVRSLTGSLPAQNPVVTDYQPDALRKQQSLQPLTLRLCLRERTVTARETVLLFESAEVFKLIPAAGRELSHQTSDPNKVDRTAICDRTASHRMKRVMRRSKLFITRKLPETQGCWVGNSRRHNKQAPQVNSQSANWILTAADRQGISPSGQQGTLNIGVPRTAHGNSPVVNQK